MLTCLENLGPLPTLTILGYTDERARNIHTHTSLILMLSNAKFLNKTRMLQNCIAMEEVDLACMTETWMRESKTVAFRGRRLSDFLGAGR